MGWEDAELEIQVLEMKEVRGYLWGYLRFQWGWAADAKDAGILAEKFTYGIV